MAAEISDTAVTGVEAAWLELLAAAGRKPDRAGSPTQSSALLLRDGDGRLRIRANAPTDCRDLLSLYLPLCQPGACAAWAVGHLGQSLDGCIATDDGESCFVTGPQNIVHLHRMRALCDAVLVGAGTVANDDPRLTTRLVPGPNPVRVVLDPQRRLGEHHGVFNDGAAETLLCAAAGQDPTRPGRGATLLTFPADKAGLRLDLLVAALARRGLRRLFVEGGGVTVSRFLAAGLLSRLQVAIAPVIIGQGRPGVSMPRAERLEQALRATPRIYRMGADILYDLDLTATGAGVTGNDDGPVLVFQPGVIA
jgi:diaminohydroxyphosphoribosylaminopyrimidine deaminase/5-amino-6-(5-phosphoribosylamino)uracil reductase